MGGSQYQRKVSLAMETGRVNLLVTGVGLVFHAFQILFHFICRAGHMTLGSPVACGTAVVLGPENPFKGSIRMSGDFFQEYPFLESHPCGCLGSQ